MIGSSTVFPSGSASSPESCSFEAAESVSVAEPRTRCSYLLEPEPVTPFGTHMGLRCSMLQTMPRVRRRALERRR